jgi:hypothetical protein
MARLLLLVEVCEGVVEGHSAGAAAAAVVLLLISTLHVLILLTV